MATPQKSQSDPDELNSENEKVEKESNHEDEALENFLPKRVRERKEYEPFTEADYHMREPSEEYRIIKEIEDKVLNFNEMLKKEQEEARLASYGGMIPEDLEPFEFKPTVKTYVVSSGILYGKGEAIFNSHLK